MCRLLMLLFLLTQFGLIVVQEQKSDVSGKIFIDFFGPPPVKPTAATVEHIPGIPPDWPKPPKPTTKRPSFPNRHQNDDIINMNTSTSAPYVLNPNRTEGEEEIIVENTDDRAGFIDWVLGIVGLGPQNPGNQNEQVSPKNCEKCSCGLIYKHHRIVGGVETQVNQYPWMVALMYNNRFYCGASVINNKYIITAAHCVNGFSKERLSAVFLDHDRADHFESQTFTRSITAIYTHRYYGSGGSYNNDIALLKLDRELSFSKLLRPVCLPTIGKSFTGHNGIAVGWGATEVHGMVSNTLREVTVPIVSNINCRQTGYGNKITDNMICAGFKQGNKDACQGDSGGPLHVLNGTQHHIVGIVSWGEGCAEPNFPGVYTRVNRYITWIKSNTKDACYC